MKNSSGGFFKGRLTYSIINLFYGIIIKITLSPPVTCLQED